MIRFFLPTLLILFSLIVVSPVRAGDLRMANRLGAYVVEIALNRNPPIVGDNRIEISITDGKVAGFRKPRYWSTTTCPPCRAWPP